jgi:membrane dipeptidase
MRKMSRRAALAGGIVSAAALAAGGAWWWSRSRKPPLGIQIPEAFLERGAVLMAENASVDVHSHAGRSYLVGAEHDSLVVRMMRDGFEAERAEDMEKAQVTASLFAVVADLPLLGLADGGLAVVRGFKPGEAYRDFNRQLDRLLATVDSGVISLALSPQDILAAHQARMPAMILCSEGADFVEDRLERIAEVYAKGLRSITLIHYNTNRLGDNQTNPPVHHGLTSFGRDVVREMNRSGMIIDLAHASAETCAGVLAESSSPVMLSHSNLDTGAVESTRFISADHARMVAETGGIIGAWPAGIGSETLADFAEQILALVDAVGADHVAVGSDMDGNYKPVLTDYADFPRLAAALLFRGLSDAEVVNILGGNFLRLFEAVISAR